jgi:hypothetical protein
VIVATAIPRAGTPTIAALSGLGYDEKTRTIVL